MLACIFVTFLAPKNEQNLKLKILNKLLIN